MSNTDRVGQKQISPANKNFAILLYAFTQGGEFRIHDTVKGPTAKYLNAQYQQYQNFTQKHNLWEIDSRNKYNQRVYKLIECGAVIPVNISEEDRVRKSCRVYTWFNSESDTVFTYLGIRGGLLDKARECFALRSGELRDLREDSLRSSFGAIDKSNSHPLYMLWKKHPVSFFRASLDVGQRNTLLESFPQYKSFDSLVSSLFSSRHRKLGVFVSGARQDGGGYYWTPRFIDFMQIYERDCIGLVGVSEEAEPVAETVTEPILGHNGTDLHLDGGDEVDVLASEKSAILARLAEIEAREHILAKQGEVVKEVLSLLEMSVAEYDCFSSISELLSRVDEVVNR